MSKKLIVSQCSPTMAGLKTGNLFACRAEKLSVLARCVRALNSRFADKGLKLMIMRYKNGRALIYMYRPSKLAADLANKRVSGVLQEMGYPVESCDGCIIELMRRLNRGESFPHEIGFFLGYPPEDVVGFIENESRNAKCVGTWKVYGDEIEARKKFDQFHKCSRIYAKCYDKHKSLDKLIVAV